MTDARAWVYIDWEPDGSAYLAVARPGREVERVPLTRDRLLDLIAQAATALRARSREYNARSEDYTEALPEHFIGVQGE